MKLIAGLGNPGQQYEKTRHNTGFLVMDEIAKRIGTSIEKKDFDALISKCNYKGETLLLMKPQTYMNDSGRAIQKAISYYHLDIEQDVLIIYDDLDLPYGKLRLRESGSAGGHNGIRSIIQQTSSQNFKRIRVGIEKNSLIPVIDYVLGKVETEKKELYDNAIVRAAQAAVESVTEPFQNVMNKYNKGE